MIENGSSLLRPPEVFVHFRDRHDEVEIQAQDHARKKYDEYRIRSVFKVRQLHLARPEKERIEE